MRVRLTRFDLEEGGRSWRLTRPVPIATEPGAVHVDHLRLATTDRSIALDGTFTRHGLNHIALGLQNLDLDALSQVGVSPVAGSLDAVLKLQGEASAPELSGHAGLNIREPGGKNLGRVSGRFAWTPAGLRLEAGASHGQQPAAESDGDVAVAPHARASRHRRERGIRAQPGKQCHGARGAGRQLRPLRLPAAPSAGCDAVPVGPARRGRARERVTRTARGYRYGPALGRRGHPADAGSALRAGLARGAIRAGPLPGGQSAAHHRKEGNARRPGDGAARVHRRSAARPDGAAARLPDQQRAPAQGHHLGPAQAGGHHREADHDRAS